MKRLFLLLGLLTGLILGYLLFWPVDIDPASWTPPAAPDLEQGTYAANDKLASAELLSTEPFGAGPEDVAIDSNGFIYGGLVDGKILRYQADGSQPTVFAETGGRPLGFHFDTLGNLIVADAEKGLLSVDPTGKVSLLTNTVNGETINFADDLEIGADGVIYFSDASSKFGVHEFRSDLMEHRPNGSLLSYDPRTGETKKLADGLFFANGIAVSPDQQFLLVVETNKYRVQKYWLQGPKAGSMEIFVDNLPGFPDGISTGENGTFWIACPNPRNAPLDALLPNPFLRKLAYRLPEALQPQEIRYGMVLGFDATGNLTYNLQDPSGRLAVITSVQEFDGQLYLGSLREPAIGRLKL
ncbi:MAG: SMP-30/gluconolactonase/LRE family protein [Bacteroidota bacterium]